MHEIEITQKNEAGLHVGLEIYNIDCQLLNLLNSSL